MYAATVESDERVKIGIRSTDLGLDFISSLEPICYEYKHTPGTVHHGFTAQNVQKKLQGIQNSIIYYDDKVDNYGMRYDELIGPIVQAIKELKYRVSLIDGIS